MPTPTWLEQFDLHLFDDQTQELEINVCAKERSREEIMARLVYDFLNNSYDYNRYINKYIHDKNK